VQDTKVSIKKAPVGGATPQAAAGAQ
jgi:hypothetical protein